jgi:hypothetical protein
MPKKEVREEIVKQIEIIWKMLDDLKKSAISLVHFRNNVISATSQKCMPDIYESKVG